MNLLYIPMNSPLIALATLACLSTAASAQTNRSIQLRSVDFDRGLIELHNFSSADVALSGWRFCSFDQDDAFRYSSPNGLAGQIIEAGTSFTVHFNNDAPAADPDRINRNDVGNFATPLNSTAWGLSIFAPPASGPIDFNDSTLIADYVQWIRNGNTNSSASIRAGQAVGQGLWTMNNDFVPTSLDTGRIELVAAAGTLLHGPDSYAVVGPTVFDEASGIDASDDNLAPTPIPLAIGTSTIVVNQQGDALGRDIDYITFDVPMGQELAELTLDAYTADANNLAFLGLQSGSVFTTDASSTGPGDLLGGVVYGAPNTGTDLLPMMAQLGTGFTPPLASGSYTLWFNQTGPQSEAVLTFTVESNIVGTSFCGPAVPNSTGMSSVLTASGSESALDNDLTLVVSSLPTNALTLAIASETQGLVPMSGGSQGTLCLGGLVGRFLAQATSSGAAGEASITVDLTAIPQPTGSASALAGDTWNFQIWHRDAVGGQATSNFSNGLSVTFN